MSTFSAPAVLLSSVAASTLLSSTGSKQSDPYTSSASFELKREYVDR